VSKPLIPITVTLAGIGRAIAITFAKDGASLAVADRRKGADDVLAVELGQLGAGAEFIRANVHQDGEARFLVARAAAHFGGLDDAVNNAGTEGSPVPLVQKGDVPRRFTRIPAGFALRRRSDALRQRVRRPLGIGGQQ
jgi:NAD(P)-dependent dehydrogenase (short-subunit alcohol dehydrogenase family)